MVLITVKTLFDEPSLSDSVVLAGNGGLDNEIKTVTVVDAPDSYEWFKGGEFVLTSAYIFEHDTSFIDIFILKLVDAGASGIGIKVGRFMDFISQSTKQLCDDHDFPIIQIPYHLVWTDIISPFYELHYQLKEDSTVVEITPNIIAPLYEASMWSSTKFMEKFSFYFPIPISIYKQNKEPIRNNSLHGIQNIHDAILKIKRLPDRGEYTRVISDNFICTFAVLPLSYDGQREYIAFASQNERSIHNIEEFISLLYKLSGSNIILTRNTNELFKDLIHRISTFSINKNELLEFEQNILLKTNMKTYTGIMIIFSDNYGVIFNEINSYIDQFNDMGKDKCNVYFHSDFMGKRASALMKIDLKPEKNLNIFVRNFIKFLTPKVHGNCRIAISNMKEGFEHLNQTFRLTEKCLKTGEIISPLKKIYYYPDIAMFLMIGTPQLSTINFDDIVALNENTKSLSFDAVHTLELFLECTNYKETAGKLFIHENTLRYRIKKISEILDFNFENPLENYNMLNQIRLWRLKMYYDSSPLH